MWDNLWLGISTALTPVNLLWCLVGVVLGTVIGLLPGMGSATGVAILIPMTLTVEPVTALILLAGIYYGAQYGGTITSVLLSTPGEAASVVTTLDGYQMARQGRAGAALAIAAIGSFTAALVSLVLLAAVAPPIAQVALRFGPPENLAVMVLALVTMVVLTTGSTARAAAMAAVGVLIACVGIDAGTGQARYTFGSINLLSGIPYVEVVIGLFAVGEVLHQIRAGAVRPIRASFRDLVIRRQDVRDSAGAIGRGSLVGFALGTLPGAGSTLASFLAYGLEKRLSRNRAAFGHGAIQGVAAPESANNAAANANFIPTLTLGIPGGATTAVLLGALTVYGIQPGPLLFTEQPELVWGLLVSFFIGNVILLVLNLPLAPVFAQLLRVPYGLLYPLILMTCFVGAFAIDNNLFSVVLVAVFGLLGYGMKRLDLPMAPLVVGVVIGGLLEKALVQSSAIFDGNLALLATRPIAVVILALAAAALITPLLARRRAGRKEHADVR
ncbi:tripartite tricarboxylate transporter permease [Saccharopolyspora flava]|uniref:Putative tricarboxylic transport membrane protein n=1 Tax=Saccharopolyspora flava TaxID=95161 RepID=A0A1I6SUM7_9PSEU|nr:tripartite tricarboxylate transporter permease [Saccharopolyspora flava]SFS80637.1 putative tricarboxylic transport membrane protein [Saccharopolyspora flava]